MGVVLDQFLYSGLALAGFTHPLHPVLITMVVGPVIASFLLVAVAFFFRKPEFYRTGRQLTVIAFIFWFPTVAVGILDWIHFYGASTRMEAIHGKFALAGVLFVILLANILTFRWGQKHPGLPLGLTLAATLCVSALGFLGGDIVFGSGKTVEASASSALSSTSSADGVKHFSDNGYDLSWKIHDHQIDVTVSYPTNGWVGFGIGKTGTMEGSHIIIGFVLDGQAIVEDHFGSGGSKHVPETKLGGHDSLISRSGTFENGKTTLSFSMPLNTGNAHDPILVPGESYKVLLANGGEDAQDLESYHGRSGRMVVDLTL